MKYKKKYIIFGAATSGRACTPLNIYNLFTPARAHQRALGEAANKIPKSLSSGGCTWSTIPEVKDAEYTTDYRGGGLQPKPRCFPPEIPEPGKGSHSKNRCAGSKDVYEYTPGGSKPPCPNNMEGTCVQVGRDEARWSKTNPPTDWTIDPPGPSSPSRPIYFKYSYRAVAGSIIKKGSGPCPPTPQPSTWYISDPVIITNFINQGLSRCEDRIRYYDCCCSCPPVKVPVIEYCQRPIQLNQAQVDQLRNGIVAAMVAGLCVLALTRGAALRALMLGAAGAAGCSTSEEEIESGCAPQ